MLLNIKASDARYGIQEGVSTIRHPLVYNHKKFRLPERAKIKELATICLDFTKDFVQVHHKNIGVKLLDLGIGGELLDHLISYFNDSGQKTRIRMFFVLENVGGTLL